MAAKNMAAIFFSQMAYASSAIYWHTQANILNNTPDWAIRKYQWHAIRPKEFNSHDVVFVWHLNEENCHMLFLRKKLV
jgi:hypothetical protein